MVRSGQTARVQLLPHFQNCSYAGKSWTTAIGLIIYFFKFSKYKLLDWHILISAGFYFTFSPWREETHEEPKWRGCSHIWKHLKVWAVWRHWASLWWIKWSGERTATALEGIQERLPMESHLKLRRGCGVSIKAPCQHLSQINETGTRKYLALVTLQLKLRKLCLNPLQ